MNKTLVIVWGPDNYNALGLIRQLSRGDVDILFLINGKNCHCATASIYCKNYVLSKNYEEGLNYLLQLNSIYNFKILIPIGDNAAETIDAKREVLLRKNYILMGTTQGGVLSKVDDKQYMSELAVKAGFTVPKSYYFSANTETNNFPYPCILKPISSEKGIKEFKTKIIYSKKELDTFKKYLNPQHKYVLQELIPKTHDILVYGCRFLNGEIALAGQFIKDRWSDDGGGSHGLLTKNLPEYLSINAIYNFLENIDYKGLFSVEYGLVGEKAYFYEVNLRNDGTSHLFYQAGANLPLAWVYNCIGQNCDVSLRITNDGWNINELYDISNVFHGRISYKKYLNDKRSATIFHYYSPEDERPWKNARKKSIYDLPLRALMLKYRPLVIKLFKKLKIIS